MELVNIFQTVWHTPEQGRPWVSTVEHKVTDYGTSPRITVAPVWGEDSPVNSGFIVNVEGYGAIAAEQYGEEITVTVWRSRYHWEHGMGVLGSASCSSWRAAAVAVDTVIGGMLTEPVVNGANDLEEADAVGSFREPMFSLVYTLEGAE